MKMTQQEIETFALQYHGIRCMKIEGYSKLGSPYACLHIIRKTNSMLEYIELRSIESLTDEEAKHALFLLDVQNFGSGIENKNWVKDAFIDNMWSHSTNSVAKSLDYLRSIGIAVPFRSFTVEDMIQQGILKLKSNHHE